MVLKRPALRFDQTEMHSRMKSAIIMITIYNTGQYRTIQKHYVCRHNIYMFSQTHMLM